MMVPDIADNGALVASLPTNELMARARQAKPKALVPLGDPFVLQPPFVGVPSLAQVNRYRRMVDQVRADDNDDASTTTYCSNIRNLHPQKLKLDQNLFKVFRSPVPAAADNLLLFMAGRYVATYQMLNCQNLLNLPVNLITTQDANGKTPYRNVPVLADRHS
jgi:hypothetical protein